MAKLRLVRSFWKTNENNCKTNFVSKMRAIVVKINFGANVAWKMKTPKVLAIELNGPTIFVSLCLWLKFCYMPCVLKCDHKLFAWVVSHRKGRKEKIENTFLEKKYWNLLSPFTSQKSRENNVCITHSVEKREILSHSAEKYFVKSTF